MTRAESSERFNALPNEHRVTIIGFEIEQEIRWIEREKQAAQKAHAANMKRYRDRVEFLERYLKGLKD